jgi:hypothetical protein
MAVRFTNSSVEGLIVPLNNLVLAFDSQRDKENGRSYGGVAL